MRRTRSGILAGLLISVFASTGPGAAQESVPVRTAPVAAFDAQHPEQTRFGSLRYLGGLQIDSADSRLGGLSGIEITPDGRTVTLVSDIGDLFSGTLDYTDGVLTGLSGLTVSRLPGEDGRPLSEKYGSDAESLRSTAGNGQRSGFLIGFERDTRILAYPVGGDGSFGTPKRVAMPAAVSRLPYNKGLEGIAVIPERAPNAGATVAFSESVPDDGSSVIPGWLIVDGQTRDIGLRRTDDFDLTDIVALPDGDLIVLERRFNMLMGVAMRVRRLRAAELNGPQPMTGEYLFTAGMAYAVDNMEGVAVHHDEDGRTVLTIVSDDNFSALQRTLLLQFELVE